MSADGTALAHGVLTGIRGAKSQAKVKMRTELSSVTVSGPEAALQLAEQASDDLRAAGNIVGDLTFAPREFGEEILDINLPSMNGFEVLERTNHPANRVRPCRPHEQVSAEPTRATMPQDHELCSRTVFTGFGPSRSLR